MKRIALIGDMQCGFRYGLTPPEYNTDSLAHGGDKGFALRARLYDFFVQGVRDYGPWDGVVHNGDALDGKGRRSGGTEQLTTDRAQQIAMAEINLAKFGDVPKRILYGTGYHTGDEEDWEYLLAKAIGARIESEAHYDVQTATGKHALSMNVRHHLGNTSSPTSRFTALNKEQLRNLLWADMEQQPRADLIVRSHVHRPFFCGEPNSWMGIVLPALCGLGSKFGARRCAGMPVRFGFAYLEVEDGGAWNIGWHVMDLKAQAATVTEL